MMRVFRLIFLGACFLCATQLAFAQAPQDRAADIEADRLDYDEAAGRLEAEGNVLFEYGGRVMRGDLFVWDQPGDSLKARGDLSVEEADGLTFHAQELAITETGKSAQFSDLRIDLPEGAFLWAQDAKARPDRIDLTRARYSACALCDPPEAAPLWQIKAARIHYDRVGENVRYAHARFEVHGIPILYTPYLRHAGARVIRRSGFLPPRFTYRSNFGSGLGLPYHLALASNYDLTLVPESTETQGTIWGGEWRHLTKAGRYDLTVTAHQPKDAPANDAVNMGVMGQGAFSFGAWQTRFDLAQANRADFFLNYDIDRSSVLTSRLSATRPLANGDLTFAAQKFTYALGTPTANRVDEQLPSLTLRLKFDDPIFGGAINFIQKFDHTRRALGTDMNHTQTQFIWHKQYRSDWGGVVDLRNHAQTDFYNYQTAQNTETQRALFSDLAVLDFSYPLIRRGEVVQYLTPRAQLMLAADTTDYDQIPHRTTPIVDLTRHTLFGASAPETQTSRFNLGAEHSFESRGGALRSFIGQSYNLSPDAPAAHTGFTRDLSSLLAQFEGDISLGRGKFTATQELRFTPNGEDVMRSESDMRATFGRLSAQIGYTHFHANQLPNSTIPREEIHAQTEFALGEFFRLSMTARQNLETDKLISNQAIVTYGDECTELRFSVSREGALDAVRTKAQTRIGFNFVLRTIGSQKR